MSVVLAPPAPARRIVGCQTTVASGVVGFNVFNEQIVFALASDRRHTFLLTRFGDIFDSSDIAETADTVKRHLHVPKDR